MATETMSIKDFMDGNYGAKKKWCLFKKKAKKYAPVAVRVSLVIGSAIIFSNFIDITHCFAAGPDVDSSEVFKDVQSSDGKIKNYIDGQLYNRIVNAFEPVIFLIKAVSYPIASVVALCGGLFIMVGSQERGFSLISRAGIGYIVVQMIPLFMRLLVEIAKAI
ncbi:hypothetical protein [Bacillus pseudomycoides]|uniref:hypothetical protein n=1 Tax=Bacillus pseudomycoides TaxID=64104 RepID=UPI000BF425B3|nr:hypothetical protein [Bacillus pseudomycoides]PFY82563.1 hypothetical protein COL53_28325 [Bacillus pseudomycoides]